MDTDFIRAHFPALQGAWTLLDNAGGSVMPEPVIRHMVDYMRRYQVQLGATYALSREAGEPVEAGRSALARWLGVDAHEVVLGASSTVLLQRLATAIRPWFQPGDEIIVTHSDHEANIGPWLGWEADGIRVRRWRIHPERLRLELADLEELLGERTRLVCFPHVSNVLGEINDVAAICRAAHRVGAWTCVDGVALAPHRRPSVRDLGADFYVLSLYKTYGPHLGLLYGRAELLRRSRGQSHFFVPEDRVPAKLEPGNVSYELAASLPGILEYFDALIAHHGLATDATRDPLSVLSDAFARHEEDLARPILELLDRHAAVRVIGPTSASARVRVPTISFVVEGRSSREIPPHLDAEHLAVRHGHFYAYRLIEDLGLRPDEGVVRVSLVHYNTSAEVARLCEVLDDVLSR